VTVRASRAAQRAGRDLASRDVGAVVIGGGCQGLGIARSLGRHGIPVCLIDDEISVARASRFVQDVIRVPELRTEQALLDALALARERFCLPSWVLYPTREENVASIAANRDELQREFRVPSPGLASIRHAWDKREVYGLAERLSIPVPITWFPQSEEDLAAIKVDGPVVLKPAIKEHFFYTTHAKAWRANTAAELLAAFRRATEIVPASEGHSPGDDPRRRRAAVCLLRILPGWPPGCQHDGAAPPPASVGLRCREHVR